MHRGVVGDQEAAVRAPKCAPSPASRSDGDQLGPLGARGRAARFHMATLRFALRRCAHLGITTQVDCSMIECRKSIPRLSEKVRMHHLHIAQSGPHWPLPCRRCALAPPSARVGAHGTRIRGGRSVHDQLRGHVARRGSRWAAARRGAEMGVVWCEFRWFGDSRDPAVVEC